MRLTFLSFLVAILGAGACGENAAGGPGDGGGDGVDDDAPQGDGSGVSERPPGVMCPAAAAGETRGLGACCAQSTECADGTCWNGFCTKSCAADSECGEATAPSPLPVGTVLK